MTAARRLFALALLLGLVLGGCGWFARAKPPAPRAPSASPRRAEAGPASSDPAPGPAPDARPAPPGRESDNIVDRVVAVVNGDAITLSELLEQVAYYLHESKQPVPPEGEAALKRRLLERMVEARLQLQEAAREKITVEDGDVAEALAEMMKRTGASGAEEFERMVKAQGLTMDTVRKKLREQIMVQKVVRRKVTLRVSVTEDEVDRYFRENRHKLETGLAFQPRHILIRPAPPAGEAEWEAARVRAEEVWGRVRAGEDFAELARAFSQDASARDGGDLGVVKQGELDPEIEAQILRLRPGDAGGPFRSRLGYHVFKLEWKENLSGEALAQTRQQIRDLLFRQKYEDRLQGWVQEVKRRAIIEIRL